MSVEKARWGGETCRKEERAVGKGTEIDGKITRDDGIDWAGFCTAARIRSVSHRNVRWWDFFRIDESWIELGCVDPQSAERLWSEAATLQTRRRERKVTLRFLKLSLSGTNETGTNLEMAARKLWFKKRLIKEVQRQAPGSEQSN